MAIAGSCLCGAVRYEVDALATPIGHCHCATCRKANARAYTSTAGVGRDRSRLLAGADKLSACESTPGKLRQFCSVCGSNILAEWIDRPYVILRVATLDADPGDRPAMHIWTSRDVHWLVDGPGLPRHAERPG